MSQSRAIIAAACLALIPGVLLAQPGERVPDAALLRAADSLTVGDYCRLAQRIMADTTVLKALAAANTFAQGSAKKSETIICNPLMSSFSLLELTGRIEATLGDVARVHNTVNRTMLLEVLTAVEQFRADTRQDGVRQVVTASLGDASQDFVTISTTVQLLETITARDNALRRLANYERKLGPSSARLNGPEVLLNYAAQRWIPGFRPTPLGGPSPWEVIASYTPGYITSAEGESGVSPVSASEFGLRFYLFGDSFGKSGIAGLFFPSYFSFGVLTASDQNGALVWPWRGRERSGGFVSWGAIKIGYIDRDRGTWLVSRQFQAVPFVF
jgi:hypothetical protein